MLSRLLKLSPVVVLFFIVCSCEAQYRDAIRGEGDIVKQEIKLETLKGVHLGFSGDVVLTKGSSQKIVMEGQQNILDNIKRTVKNGIWHIYFDKNVRDMKNVTVYITLSDLSEVSLSGSGSIRSTNTFSGLDNLALQLSGSGNMQLTYDARETDLHLAGSGEIELAGNSPKLSISISGSGDVNAAKLQTETSTVRISGSGDASVSASRELQTMITGSGDIRYSGSASVNSKVTGSGSVSKVSH